MYQFLVVLRLQLIWASRGSSAISYKHLMPFCRHLAWIHLAWSVHFSHFPPSNCYSNLVASHCKQALICIRLCPIPRSKWLRQVSNIPFDANLEWMTKTSGMNKVNTGTKEWQWAVGWPRYLPSVLILWTLRSSWCPLSTQQMKYGTSTHANVITKIYKNQPLPAE